MGGQGAVYLKIFCLERNRFGWCQKYFRTCTLLAVESHFTQTQKIYPHPHSFVQASHCYSTRRCKLVAVPHDSICHEEIWRICTIFVPINDGRFGNNKHYRKQSNHLNKQTLRSVFKHYSHLISSRLCPSTAGCSPPSMSSIFVCLLPS